MEESCILYVHSTSVSTSDFQSEVGEVFGEIGGKLPAKFGRRFSSFFCWEKLSEAFSTKNSNAYFTIKLHFWRALQLNRKLSQSMGRASQVSISRNGDEGATQAFKSSTPRCGSEPKCRCALGPLPNPSLGRPLKTSKGGWVEEGGRGRGRKGCGLREGSSSCGGDGGDPPKDSCRSS